MRRCSIEDLTWDVEKYLSKSRALSMLQYLIKKREIDAQRTSFGYFKKI
jgi:hypothetical protein